MKDKTRKYFWIKKEDISDLRLAKLIRDRLEVRFPRNIINVTAYHAPTKEVEWKNTDGNSVVVNEKFISDSLNFNIAERNKRLPTIMNVVSSIYV